MKFLPYVIIGCLLVALFYFWENPKVVTETIVEYKTDTIVKWDTVFVEKPVYKTITKIEKDTVFVSDTVFVVLDRETKIYEDSTYKCQISGIKADLDWIETYPRTTYITSEKVVQIKEKQPLIEFRPSVGLGYGIINNKLDIWVGGSATINIKRKKK